ncbi:STAS domain-containing protein [bacterium]|nr:STAS domain-containing protein [bacterium]
MSAGEYFHLTQDRDVVVLEVERPVGSLCDDAVMRELDSVLKELRNCQCRKLVIDFHQTPYFGSSMLEALRLMWTTIHKDSGEMVLCNLSEVGREILQVSKFDHIWPIVADRTTALSQWA